MAIISAMQQGIQVGAQAEMNGGSFWSGAWKGAAIGAATSLIPYGVGQLYGHAVGALGTELLRAGTHGVANGLLNMAEGGKFGTGFVTGLAASAAGSLTEGNGFSSLGVIASTTAAGALASGLSGGDWMSGAMQGMNIGAYNFEGGKGTKGDPIRISEVVVTHQVGVGQPGFGESLIPIWGSARAAIDDFQNGRWGWGLFNSALAVSDVFLVKAAAMSLAKGTITLAGKYALKQAVENPIYVGREVQALANPRVAAMMKGKGIDRAFRITASNNLILNSSEKMGLISISPVNRGADIVGKGILEGTWWDVTTSGAWNSHILKYATPGSAKYVGSNGIGLIY